MKQSILWLAAVILLMSIVGHREAHYAAQQAAWEARTDRLSAELLNEKHMHLQTQRIHEAGAEMLSMRRVATDMSSGEFIDWLLLVLSGYGLEEHTDKLFMEAHNVQD